jgi:hypothetical protein
MSYRPKGLDMKRLEEEDSNLESDADSIRPPNLNDEEEFAGALVDKEEIGQCLLDNQTINETFISKASKVSKRDVDGIKTTKLDFSELNDRILNRNHTHIIEKASAYTRKHGLVSFGPKISRLDALGNQMDRSFRAAIEKFNQNKSPDEKTIEVESVEKSTKKKEVEIEYPAAIASDTSSSISEHLHNQHEHYKKAKGEKHPSIWEVQSPAIMEYHSFRQHDRHEREMKVLEIGSLRATKEKMKSVRTHDNQYDP